MKVYKEETVECHGGKHRLLLATNVKELELLYGIVQKACLHFPQHPIRFLEDYSRLKNMKESLGKGLRALRKDV